jgi:ABC-type xylose transport system permease subunit
VSYLIAAALRGLLHTGLTLVAVLRVITRTTMFNLPILAAAGNSTAARLAVGVNFTTGTVQPFLISATITGFSTICIMEENDGHLGLL